METVLTPIILVDDEWTILEANRSAERAMRMVRQHILGANFKTILGLDDDPDEMIIIKDDDHEVLFDYNSNSWVDANGAMCRTIVLNDVTNIKLAEAVALRSEQRFRHLAENTADMIVTISPERVRTYISPACEKMLGFKPEEMVGQSPLAGIHPDDRAHTFEVSESLTRSSKGRIARYRHMHKDGHYVWLEASFQAVRDSVTGEMLEFVGTVRDISQRAPEELAATESNARMKEANRLLEMSESLASVGHWRIDLVTGNVLWSEQVYHLHGVGKDYEPNLRGAINFYHEDDRDQVATAMQKATENGEGFGFRARIVQPNGEIRHIHSVGQTEIAPTGETLGIFGVIRDISDEVAAEEELRASRDQAQIAVKAKSAFLANMSHEIRTPMNGVIGFAGLMLEDELPPAQRERAKMILDSGEAMLELLNDILDLSKIEAGQMQIASNPINLKDIVTSCGRMFDATATSKGLTLNVDHAAGTPQLILGDALRLRQVLSNLIGNAIKFTDSGAVAITTRREGGQVVIAVTDSGIGIEPSRQDAIFEQFVQADVGIAGDRGGTGLGLAIARQLVAQMGGSIGLESEPGEGATFTVSLPFEEIQGEDPGTSQGETAAGAQSQVAHLPTRSVEDERILLAEDNEVNCYLINEMADRLGLRLYIAGDGLQAVQMVLDNVGSQDPFKLVLMDLQMPQMDGLSATRAIRDAGIEPEQLPILALTANAYADDIEACLQAGMQSHLAKPITFPQLRNEILRWLPQRAKAKAEPNMVELPPEIRASYERSLGNIAQMLGAIGAKGAIEDGEVPDLAGLFHSIAGTAGYFGQAERGDAASGFERALLKAPDGASRMAVVDQALAEFGSGGQDDPQPSSKMAR